MPCDLRALRVHALRVRALRVCALRLRAVRVQDNRPQYSGIIRHKNPDLCPVHEFARQLCHRLVLKKQVACPDPFENFDGFNHTPIIAGLAGRAVKYKTVLNDLGPYFKEVQPTTTKKAHAFRAFMARLLDAQG